MRYRYRLYGNDEWTVVDIKGELDYLCAHALENLLGNSNLHVQKFEDGRWEDVE